MADHESFKKRERKKGLALVCVCVRVNKDGRACIVGAAARPMLPCAIFNESLMSFTAVTELQSELFDAKAGAEVISHAK